MKKVIPIVLILTCMLGLIGCTISSSEIDSESSSESVSVTDYPAAIMVDGEVYFYLVEVEPMSGEVADRAIMGYTTSYTDTFPQKDGETNFNRELGMPYAKVKDGVAVFYNNEWHLCALKD